jgi:hypothetical protein
MDRARKRRVAAVAGVIVAIVVGLVAAISASGKPSTADCTDKSTACLDAAAMSYVNALGGNGAAVANAVRAAPDVQRWENGVHNVINRQQLVSEIKVTQIAVADIRDVRLYPTRGGNDVFAMYLADGGLSRQASITAHVVERFHISHGLITQIEVVECAGGPNEQSFPAPVDPISALDLNVCLRAAVPPIR